MKKDKKEVILGLIALFMICLIINTPIVHALFLTQSKPTVIVENNSVEIKWSTEVNSTGIVNYGVERNSLDITANSNTNSMEHSVSLTDLLYDQAYYYTITISNGTEHKILGETNPYLFVTQQLAEPEEESVGTGNLLSINIPEFYDKLLLSITGNVSENVKYVMFYSNPAKNTLYGRGGNPAYIKSDGTFFGQTQLTDDPNGTSVVVWGGNAAHEEVFRENYTVYLDTLPPTIDFVMPNGSETTDMQLSAKVSEPVYVTYDVTNSLNESESINLTQLYTPNEEGMIDFMVPLSEDHSNIVSISIKDRAGNGKQWEAIIDVMIEPPQLFSHNLDALTPSYVQEVVVKGNATPNTVVLIRVNGKESSEGAFSTSFYDVITNTDSYIESERYIAKVGEDGLFEIPIMLTQELYHTTPYETDTFQEEYQQSAPDYEEDETVIGSEEYGLSTSFDNNIEIIVIDKLGRNATFSQIIKFAKCGFGSDWNVQVSDFVPSAITPSLLREGMAQISFSSKYEWQGPGENAKLLGPPVVSIYELNKQEREKYNIDPEVLVKTPVRPTASADYKKVGYVVEFNKIDKPIEFWHNITEKDSYEETLVKVPLKAEIRYQYEDVFGNTVEKIQRHCFDASVFVDIQIPPDTIPVVLLNNSIQFLGSTIKVIDAILEPLKTVTLWAFVGCLISWVFFFFYYLNQWIECGGDSKYYNDGESGCKQASDKRWEFEKKMQWLCDRSFCPSAPTVMKYIEEQHAIWKGVSADKMQKLDEKPPECTEAQVIDSLDKNDGGCGQEYMEHWDSTCVIMDELDRSKCIDDPEGKGCGGAKKIWYAVSGFCEAKNQKKEVLVQRGDKWYQYDPNIDKWCRGEAGSLERRSIKNEDTNKYEVVEENFICNGDYLTEEEAANLGLMKANSKEYVVDPTAGFLSSLQCVCLPAITGYLQLIRNVLNAIMQCFQSILVTGDGSSGLCRAVLTTYICDLLFDAIRCFMNRMAGGGGSERSGIEGFVQNVADAGQSVRNSIVNRYGKTALYRSMFDERKLIHAICLFAFTGDFDFDLKGALTGIGAVPLNSEAFVHPATRRFMGSNPLNNGYATWVYHLGIGIIAGADLRYKVRLICSASDTCSSADGFPNNRCDCYGMGDDQELLITSHVGTGNLKAGDFLGGTGEQGDVYVKVEKPYRYDKVEIWYEWEDNMGKKQSDFVRKDIRLTGGKPPVECEFDVLKGYYHCEYEIGERGTAEFLRTPQPVKDRFYLNEDIVVDFAISKSSPNPEEDLDRRVYSDQSQPLPFILLYRVRDHHGNLLKFDNGKTEQTKMLVEDKTYFSPDLGNLPFFRIKLDHFGGAEQDIRCTSEGGTPSLDVKGEGGRCIMGNTNAAAYGKAIRFKGSNDGKQVWCSLHEIEKSVAGETITGKGRDIDKSKDKQAKVTGTGVTKTYDCYGVLINLAEITKDASYFVKVIPQETAAQEAAGEVGCRDYTSTRPANWKVEFELRYCNSGRNDTQATFDNCEMSNDIVHSRGQPQAYTGQSAINVKVVCGDSEESKLSNCSDLGWVNRLLDKNCLCDGVITGPDIDSNYCEYKEVEEGTFEEQRKTYSSCNLKNAMMSSPGLVCDCNGDQFMECGTGKICEIDPTSGQYACVEGSCTVDTEKEDCSFCEYGGVCRYGKCRCNEAGTTEGRKQCLRDGFDIDIGDGFLHKCVSEDTAEGCDPNTGNPTNEYSITNVDNNLHRIALQDKCSTPENKCKSQGFTFDKLNDGYLYKCISQTQAQGCKLSTGNAAKTFDISVVANPAHKQLLVQECSMFSETNVDDECYFETTSGGLPSTWRGISVKQNAEIDNFAKVKNYGIWGAESHINQGGFGVYSYGGPVMVDYVPSYNKKEIALTFDLCDGSFDEQILNTLNQKGTKATFFAAGKWLDNSQHSKYITSIKTNNLFEFQSHSYSHRNPGSFYYMENGNPITSMKGTNYADNFKGSLKGTHPTGEQGVSEMTNDLNKVKQTFANKGLSWDYICRLPVAHPWELSPEVLNAMKPYCYELIGFTSIFSEPLTTAEKASTSTPIDCKAMVNKAVSKAKSGAIYLMHANHPYEIQNNQRVAVSGKPFRTGECIGEVIDALKNQGYSFVTVSELLNKAGQLQSSDKAYITGSANVKKVCPEESLSGSSDTIQSGSCKIPAGVKVAFVGDSLTAANQYQQYFYKQCPEKKANNEFKTFAKSGAGSLEILNNYVNGPNGAIAWKPNYVIIMAGVNDQLKDDTSKNKVITNLGNMYKSVNNANAKAVGLSILPWKGYSSWTEESGKNTKYVNNWLSAIPSSKEDAALAGYDYHLFKFIRAYDELKDSSDDEKLNTVYDDGSHLHLSPEGYQLLGKIIYNNVAWT